jgi:hypothetical protein
MSLKYFGRSALIGVIAAGVSLGAVLPNSVVAQERSRIWLGLGLGSGARSDGASGAALLGEIVYQTRAHHFALRGLGVIDPFGDSNNDFGEIGILYGRAALRKWGHGSAAAGLAITGVSSCGETGSCTTVGIPVVAEAALRLASVVGVGAQGYANLNTKSIYGGVAFFLQLGWLP